MHSKQPETKPVPELTGLELEIMRLVWELGECSSGQVIAACRHKRALADTTVRTVLANLRKKGYLEPVPTIERGFRLKPRVSQRSVARGSLRKLVSSLFANSPKEAVLSLMEDEQMSEEDLAEIERLIESRKQSTEA